MTDQEADRLAQVFFDAYEAADRGRVGLRAGARALVRAAAVELVSDRLAQEAFDRARPVDLSYVMLAQADMGLDDCRPAGMRVQNDVFEY